MMEFSDALVNFKVIEVRFSRSGKVSWVGVKKGDSVKMGQQLAKLESGLLQKRHQKELKDYEKARADFEQLKNKLAGIEGPEKMYLADRAQADLEAAVLGVEIAQLELDEAVLYSPVAGVIKSDSNIVQGINISPASFPFEIVADGSYYISTKVEQDKLIKIRKDQYAEFTVAGIDRIYKGRVLRTGLTAVSKKSQSFEVAVILENYDGLLPGFVGKLKIENKT